MELSTTRETLKYTQRALGTIVSWSNIYVNRDGMRALAMDPSHVRIVDVNIGKNAFERYFVEKEYTIPMDVEKFGDVLRAVRPGSMVDFEYDSESKKAKFAFDYITRTIDLKDIGPIDPVRVPKLKLEHAFEMSKENYIDAVNVAGHISDSLKMNYSKGDKKGKISLSAFNNLKNDSTERMRVKCKLVKEPQRKNHFHSSYAIYNLLPVLETFPDNSIITTEFAKDYPCRLSAKFADGHGSLTYLLSPRIYE